MLDILLYYYNNILANFFLSLKKKKLPQKKKRINSLFPASKWVQAYKHFIFLGTIQSWVTLFKSPITIFKQINHTFKGEVIQNKLIISSSFLMISKGLCML